MYLKINNIIKIIFFFIFIISCTSEKDTSSENPITQKNRLDLQRDSLRNKLLSVMNISLERNKPIEFRIIENKEFDDYSLTKLLLLPEDEEPMPSYLLKPNHTEPPYPVMITLQGHSPGMYISIGQTRSEKDVQSIKGGRDLAIQAVKNGWAALAVEQKGFGERAEEGVSCNDMSLRMSMKGKTMLGERSKDIMRAVDFIESQEDLNSELIGTMGNSSGGTTSYFAASIDERIQLAVVSCSFSTYKRSWLKYKHCSCGFMPGILEVGDMPDFSKLIAPRKLIIVAGKEDHLADIEGVREGYRIAKKAYKKAGAPNNVVLIEGDGGHQFYPKLTWPIITEFKKINKHP